MIKAKTPKVTVLMSVYNGERCLREAIDSILNQTFKDFEFLIVNDGSTDKTVQILRSYLDPRIKIINNSKNMGLTRSLNKGLKIAKGSYIARMDADDISIPHRLEQQARLLDKNKRIGLLGTYYAIFDKEGKTLWTVKPPNKRVKEKLLRENQFTHGSMIFRRKCIEKVDPYREEFKFAQDYDLWLRIAEFFDIATVPKVLYQWRFDPESISVNKRTQQNKYAALAIKLAKERKVFGKDSIQVLKEKGDRKMLNNLLWEIDSKGETNIAEDYNFWARPLFAAKKHSAAWKLLWKSFTSNPFYKSTWIVFLKAIAGLY